MTYNILIINLISIISIMFLYNISLYTHKVYNIYIIWPYIKKIGLLTTILLLYNIIIYNILFNSNILGYQFIDNIFNINWGIDSISLLLLSLLFILLPIALLSNWININNKFTAIYNILIILLGLLMALNFICLDIISFYILFESTLAPLFILIGIYGALNKNRASYYILIYTLFSSLYMLLSLSIILYIYNDSDYNTINNYILCYDIQCIIYIGLMIGILVKAPVWPVHSWLPIAHSESPIGGSILLAGVILKIAIYGIIRLILINTADANLLFIPIIYTICVITIIYIGIITIRQYDLKVIIAYSSIGHMAVCIMGILSNNIIGINGSIILSISHGLVSPSLFIIVGAILYDRYHNRLLFYYQGLATYMPILSIYLIIYSLCNIGIPLSGNFIGELLSFIGSYNINPILTIIGTISVLISACYQMRLSTKLIGGNKSIYMYITQDMNNRELLMLNILLIPIILIGVTPYYITNLLDINISGLLYHII